MCPSLPAKLSPEGEGAKALDVHFVSPAPSVLPWERRAPARLQKPRWSVALPGKSLENWQ